MTLTAEQKQDIIASLKKHYADGKKWLEENETKSYYIEHTEDLTDRRKTLEYMKCLCERLESGEDIDLGDSFNDSWGNIMGLIMLWALFNPAKDGE